MKPIRKRAFGAAKTPSEQDLFKEYYPMVLAVVDEIRPLLHKQLDQREVLAMASMHLGQMVRSPEPLGRRDLRKALEQHLVDAFVLHQEDPDDIIPKGRITSLDKDDLRGSRVLIVDDSSMARRQIQFFLEMDGFDVYEAKSGEEALWLVHEIDPDLVLMDVSMEGMDGMETCRRLKEDPENTTLPIIFLSAKGEREEIVKGFKSGAIDYIVKPFHPAESLTRIRTQLRVKKLAELREKHIIELEQINRTKDRVLRIASHDLRNPVAAIAGLAEFLKEESEHFSEDHKEIIDCIDEAGKSVVNLLNELLDLTALDGDNVETNKEQLDLLELSRNLMPLFKGEAERKDILISVEAEETIPHVYADRQQMRRLIDNLVNNGIKFTPAGGRVTLRMVSEGETIWLYVDDTGPGIPETESANLFKEFGKTSNVPTGGEKSTGLGLFICSRIVEAHDGTIGFENLSGGGARFSVSLPAVR